MEDKIMVGRRKDAGTRSYLAQEMQDGSMDSKKNGQHAFGKHIAQCSCGGRMPPLPHLVRKHGFWITLFYCFILSFRPVFVPLLVRCR